MFRILIIDDDDQTLFVFDKMLEFLGYTSILETDANKALKLFKKNPYKFDLIITDQSMPTMNGTELINEMWLMRSSMKFILCSGHDSSYFATDGFNKKSNIYFLKKPFDMKMLNDIMSIALPFGDC